MEFIEYPKCSTCKKAKLWLDGNNIDYVDRNIVIDNPTYEEIYEWVNRYSIQVNKLFNTCGIKYRELNLKDKLISMDDDEKIKMLASDGMLVKRPIIIDENKILVGFKEKEWNEYFK